MGFRVLAERMRSTLRAEIVDHNAERRRVVCSLDELPLGSVKHVAAGKFGVSVFNVGGALHALTNYCPHRGGPVCLGPVTGLTRAGDGPYEIEWSREGEILRCPWHGMEFDLITGAAVIDKRYKIKKVPVAVVDGLVVLEGIEL